MKKVLFFAAIVLMNVAAHAQTSDKLTVRIEGMHCDHCAHKVKTLLEEKLSLSDIDFDLEKRTIAVAYDGQAATKDKIMETLAATERYKAQPYSADDVILREKEYRIADMHCAKCAHRISESVGSMEGVDSLGFDIENHNVLVRYDANRTSRDSVREALLKLGFTPVSYYKSDAADYAYLLIPADKANAETEEQAEEIEGVNDVCVNAKRNALAITFVKKKTSAEQIIAQLKTAGVEAKLPAPHVCKEEAE